MSDTFCSRVPSDLNLLLPDGIDSNDGCSWMLHWLFWALFSFIFLLSCYPLRTSNTCQVYKGFIWIVFILSKIILCPNILPLLLDMNWDTYLLRMSLPIWDRWKCEHLIKLSLYGVSGLLPLPLGFFVFLNCVVKDLLCNFTYNSMPSRILPPQKSYAWLVMIAQVE